MERPPSCLISRFSIIPKYSLGQTIYLSGTNANPTEKAAMFKDSGDVVRSRVYQKVR